MVEGNEADIALCPRKEEQNIDATMGKCSVYPVVACDSGCGGPRFNVWERICPLLMLRNTVTPVFGRGSGLKSWMPRLSLLSNEALQDLKVDCLKAEPGPRNRKAEEGGL